MSSVEQNTLTYVSASEFVWETVFRWMNDIGEKGLQQQQKALNFLEDKYL